RPEPDRADPDLRHPADPDQHPLRGSAVLPRRRRTTADRDLGRHARRGRPLLHDAALRVLAWPGDIHHGPVLQPVRGRAARRAGPEDAMTPEAPRSPALL